MIQINTKRALATFIFIIIPVITIVSSVYMFLESRGNVKGVQNTVRRERIIPKIVNVIPKSVRAGEEYMFKPVVSGEEGVNYTVEILDGPSWLSLDSDGYIRGISEEEGTYRLEITVSDGFNSSSVVEYLIVEYE